MTFCDLGSTMNIVSPPYTPLFIECRNLPAWPFNARSHLRMSIVGFSGLEFLKVPFHVLPSNGRKASNFGFKVGVSALACGPIANAQSSETRQRKVGTRILVF